MRFMLMMIPAVYQGKSGQAVRPDFMPDPADVEKMTRFNEELMKAGVLLGLDGLHPPVQGARITFTRTRPAVANGPFSETQNVLGGYWIISVKSREEAVAWATKCPAQDGDVIEVRQVFEESDFSPEVQKAAGGSFERTKEYISGVTKQV